jgi:NADH dehydrogenase
MKKKVIIIGGGYGGVRAAKALAKHKELEILLLDSKPYHYLQTDVYDFIANKTTITDISVSLVTLFYDGSVNFLQRKVSKIIPSENKILTSIGEELSYDYLITANGSRTFFPSFIEGLIFYSARSQKLSLRKTRY